MEAFGRYQLHEQLGHGGMGVVYRAHDTVLERVVALKLVAGPYANDPEMRERFFREARAAGHLTHKNIVTIYDLGEHDGRPYIAMEYLAGEDLQRRLARPERMPLSRRLEVAIDVCQGVEHAHHHGIVHRDLKPANIFLTDDGGVKILDFGLARPAASQLTHSNMLMGTLNYMAPEQVRGERADQRSDIFSIGVVMYELFGGRKAFEGDSVASTLYKILEDIPEPLSNFDDELPPGLWEVVERALAKNREDRFQSVSTLLGDLHDIYQSVPAPEPSAVSSPSHPRSSARLTPRPVRATSVTPKPSPPARAPSGVRRGVLAGSIVVLLLGVAAVGWIVSRPTGAPDRPLEQSAAPPPAATPAVSQPRAAEPPPSAAPATPSPQTAPRGAVEQARARTGEQDARTARGRMVEGRAAAEAAGAAAHASTAFRDAVRRQQEADRLLKAQDFAAAASRYYEASGLFREAETIARAAQTRGAPAEPPPPTSTTAAKSPEPPTVPAADPIPAPPVTAPSAPAAVPPAASQPLTPQPEPAPATPPQPAAPSGPSDEERVGDLLGRYREALESRSLERLKDVWPSLGGTAENAIREEFRHASRISVAIESPHVTLTGSTGHVTFVRNYSLTTVDGQSLHSSSQVTMTVRRAGAGWVIDALRFSPR